MVEISTGSHALCLLSILSSSATGRKTMTASTTKRGEINATAPLYVLPGWKCLRHCLSRERSTPIDANASGSKRRGALLLILSRLGGAANPILARVCCTSRSSAPPPETLKQINRQTRAQKRARYPWMARTKHPKLICTHPQLQSLHKKRTSKKAPPHHHHHHHHRSFLTVPPMLSPRSSAMRSATAMALIRRGCVQTILQPGPMPGSSSRNCGTWVDFPQPVSPDTRHA